MTSNVHSTPDDLAVTTLLGDERLRAVVEAVVPADEFPSAWQVGAPEFLDRLLRAERAGLAAELADALDYLDETAGGTHGRRLLELSGSERSAAVLQVLSGADEEGPRRALVDFAGLVIQGYYGDPGNGGNDGASSWSMIGYRTTPEGASWPEVADASVPTVDFAQLRPAYDAIVVGSGAGGGVAACVLAEAGLSVLLVERGHWVDTSDVRVDHLRSQRQSLGYDTVIDPPAAGNPRLVPADGGEVKVLATDPRWGSNAQTVGGGTRVYGAQAWRFCEDDFRMASLYGVPAGSSLADWPIGYGDLESDYDRAEWELGVAGDSEGDRTSGHRRRGYPMRPFPHAEDSARLARGADRARISTTAVPLLINTEPYNGRGACIRCAACVGFACPGEFKTDTRNTVIPRAVDTGRCDVLVDAQVTSVVTDDEGRVSGVRVCGERGEDIIAVTVEADQVVLAAGAVETARLLLASRSPREPSGLGNAFDQVGRNLQAHVYAGAWGIFDDPVQDSVGPGPGIATTDHRHRNPGIVGGAMLANDFVPTPLSIYRAGVDMGLFPAWGAESKAGMRELFPRLLMVMGPVHEVPNPESRVTIAEGLTDRFGMPVARLSGAVHPEDLRTAAYIADRAAEWVRAAGARETKRILHVPEDGPSRGQHQAGTCRMGSDPRTSVTDEWGRVWGHENLRIADASLHVTNGGVNPVLTVLALAYRVAGRLVADKREQVAATQ